MFRQIYKFFLLAGHWWSIFVFKTISIFVKIIIFLIPSVFKIWGLILIFSIFRVLKFIWKYFFPKIIKNILLSFLVFSNKFWIKNGFIIIRLLCFVRIYFLTRLFLRFCFCLFTYIFFGFWFSQYIVYLTLMLLNYLSISFICDFFGLLPCAYAAEGEIVPSVKGNKQWNWQEIKEVQSKLTDDEKWDKMASNYNSEGSLFPKIFNFLKKTVIECVNWAAVICGIKK